MNIRVLTLLLPILLLVPSALAQQVPITTTSEEARALFMEARELSFGDNEKAREQFDAAIELDPDFALAYIWRALISPVGEREHLNQEALARSEGASEGERLWIEAHSARLRGDQRRELELLEELARRYPDDAYVHHHIGVTSYFQRDFDRAADAFERAIRVKPDLAAAHNMRGYTAKAQGDYERAEQALNEYVRLNPQNANAYDSLGELYLKLGRLREARAQFERAVEVDPMFTYALQNIGNAYLLGGDYEAARRVYRETMEKVSEYPIDGPSDRAWIQARIAESYVHEGALEEARAEIERLVEVASEAPPHVLAEAHNRRYLFYREIGDIAEAERSAKAIEEVTEQADLPESVKRRSTLTSRLYLGLLDVDRGAYDAASEKLEEYARGLEASGDAFAPRGRALAFGTLALARGEYAEAARLLADADQSNPYVLYRLGVAHAALGEAQHARDYFRRAADHNEPYHYEMEYALVRPKARMALAAGGHIGAVPLLVADRMASEFYTVIGEDETLRMVEFRLPPGEADRAHAHPHEAVYFLRGGTVRLQLADGTAPELDIPDGHVLLHEPWAHRVENVGNTEVHAVFVEQKPVEANAVWNAIQDIGRAYEEAFAQGDAQALARFYSTDAQLLPMDSDRIAGEEAIREFWQQSFQHGLTTIEIDLAELFPTGESATGIGTFRLMAEGEVVDTGKYVAIWQQTADGWKIHRHIWNSDRPAQRVAFN